MWHRNESRVSSTQPTFSLWRNLRFIQKIYCNGLVLIKTDQNGTIKVEFSLFLNRCESNQNNFFHLPMRLYHKTHVQESRGDSSLYDSLYIIFKNFQYNFQYFSFWHVKKKCNAYSKWSNLYKLLFSFWNILRFASLNIKFWTI